MYFPENVFNRKPFLINPGFDLNHHIDAANLSVEWHYHDYHEVYIYLSGNVDYFVEETHYKLSPGDILLISAKDRHKPTIKKGAMYERIVLFVRPDFIAGSTIEEVDIFRCFSYGSENNNRLLHPHPSSMNTLMYTLFRLFKAMNSDAFGAKALNYIYLTEFLIHLNQCFFADNKTGENKASHDIVDEIVRYINENIDKNLNLDDIAREFFVSKYYLSHSFKLHTGTSPYKYIKYKRLLIAASALKSGASVSDACDRCGYGDYNNFIRAFRELYGVTPRQFSISSQNTYETNEDADMASIYKMAEAD